MLDYTDVLLKGIAVTAQLTLTGGVLGVAVAIFGAWARTQGPAWLRAIVGAYVEMIRNTPFLIQLFFIFFGLPSLGVQLPEMVAALAGDGDQPGRLRHRDHPGRAGGPATRPVRGRRARLAMSPLQVFRYVVRPWRCRRSGRRCRARSSDRRRLARRSAPQMRLRT